jgi:hypothetical protein
MFVVLVTHSAVGLRTSLALVAQTIKNNFGEKIKVESLIVPFDFTRATAAAMERRILFTRPIDVVVFFEHLVDHPQLWAAPHRILIPNPEWLGQHDVASVPRLTEIWHKTRFSLTRLSGRFLSLKHSYIGFSSPDISGNAPDFDRFIHFKGASVQKQTEIVLAAWRRHPEWPELSVQSYILDPAFLNFPEWLQWKNIRFKYCLMSAEEYRSDATLGGVHLCPSSVEGFGHYLNEARSMGALAVTTNAAPMNELIDETCGVLITPVRTEPQNFGVRHIIDETGFEKAIQTVLAMSIEQRKAIGANARRRYVQDREQFQTELTNQFLRIGQLPL